MDEISVMVGKLFCFPRESEIVLCWISVHEYHVRSKMTSKRHYCIPYCLSLFNFFLDLFSSSSSAAYDCGRLSITDTVFINFERDFLLMITLYVDKDSFESLLTLQNCI